jgi:hypothetical protein
LANQPVDVTLIDRTNHHLFQPLLYQVATAMLSPADIAQPIRTILKYAKNIRVEALEIRLDESSDVVWDRVHGGAFICPACLKVKKGWSVLEAAAPMMR